jgi:hypothetical protein
MQAEQRKAIESDAELFVVNEKDRRWKLSQETRNDFDGLR